MFGRRKKKDPHQELEEAMVGLAARFAREHGRTGGEGLDFSPASLDTVDAYLGDLHERGAGLDQDTQWAVSAYVFEVTRRQYGGSYLRGDEANPFVLVIGGPDFQVGFCVMAKVLGRVVNGPEDDIPFFYQGLEQPVRARRSATIV